MKRVLYLLILIPLLVACISNRMNLRAGITSFKSQDYRSAFIHLKPEAEKGQADAQYAVGYMYYYGYGVVEDRKKAWFWINSAAELGQSDALTALGILKKGSDMKRRIFQSNRLQHVPVQKEMY